MHTLNDDDMEDLFRRAGEDYPLKTDGADWNKVIKELHPAKDDLPGENKKKKDYRYLLLMLLLPLGFICGRYVGRNNNGVPSKANKEVNITRKPTDEALSPLSNAGAAVIKPTEINGGNGISSKTDNTRSKLVSDITVRNKVIDKGLFKTSKTRNLLFKTSLNGTVIKDGDKVAMANTLHHSPTPSASYFNNPTLKTDIFTKVDTTKKPSASPIAEQSIEKRKEGINGKQKIFKKSFYYSLLIGPDLSTVKLQHVSKAGYSIGVMLGYQFSRKISLEGGILWDKKNYYTNGEYLDTTRLKLPDHSTVLEAKGYCNMIEIPVNIKYKFLTTSNYSWFVSAGASSYLMKNEDYNLTYKRYNIPYVEDYGYSNSSKDLFAIMNVSAGYQKTFGKNTNISVAPYIKVPLKGVGIGKLPITSTGMYLTVSHNLH